MFERDVLPAHLARTRWYPERSAKAIQPKLTSAIPFCDIGDNRPWLAFFETTQHGGPTRYLLPMQIEWVRFDRERYNPHALAAVRQGAREGTLLDVATDPIFIALLLRNLQQSLTVEEGTACAWNSGRPPDLRQADPAAGTHPRDRNREAATARRWSMATMSSRSIASWKPVSIPEIEIGRYLTDVAGFANAPPLLGSVELVEGNANSAIANVHAFIENQGDAWTVTSAYLDRFVDDLRVLENATTQATMRSKSPYLRYMAQAGRRVAELHIALAGHDELPISRPSRSGQRTSGLDRRPCGPRGAVFEALRPGGPPQGSRMPLVDRVLAQRPTLPGA